MFLVKLDHDVLFILFPLPTDHRQKHAFGGFLDLLQEMHICDLLHLIALQLVFSHQDHVRFFQRIEAVEVHYPIPISVATSLLKELDVHEI